MDDAVLMRRFKGLGDPFGHRQRFVHGNRSPGDPVRQRLPFHELHDQSANAVGLFEAVNDRDVRMIQGRKASGFAFESRQPLRILRKRIGKNLDGDVTTQVASVA